MCDGMSNKFCELSESQTYVCDSIKIAGEHLEVKKIMFFTEDWIERNWYYPIVVRRSCLLKLEKNGFMITITEN